MQKYCLRGNNVFVNSSDVLRPAYIFINREKIEDVVCDDSQHQSEIQKKRLTYPMLEDFQDLFIIPGCIDVNFQLHALSKNEFSQIELFTLLATMGGVTTVLNAPPEWETANTLQIAEQQAVTLQLNNLRDQSKVDFGQLAALHLDNVQEANLIKKSGAAGFKLYLSPQDTQSSYLKDYNAIREVLLKAYPLKLPIFIHTQVVSHDSKQQMASKVDSVAEKKTKMIDQFQKNFIKRQKQKKFWGLLIQKNSKEVQYQLLTRAEQMQYSSKSLNEPYQIPQQANDLYLSNEFVTYNSKPTELMAQSVDPKLSKADYDQFFRTNSIPIDPEQMDLAQQQDFPMFTNLKIQDEKILSQPIKSMPKFFASQQRPQPVGDYFDDEEDPPFVQTQSLSPTSRVSPPQQVRPQSQSSGLLQRRQMSNPSFNTKVLNLKRIDCDKSLVETPILKRSEENIDVLQSSKVYKYYQDYLFYLTFRPTLWENCAINLVRKAIGVQKSKINRKLFPNQSVLNQFENGTLVFTNFSDALTISNVLQLRLDIGLNNLNIFCEIGYPFIYFDQQYIKDSDTRFKNDPPIRMKQNKKLIQQALDHREWITCVSSCHRYIPELYKKTTHEGDFRRSMGGLNSIGLTIPVTWTIEMMKIKNELHLSSKEIGALFNSKIDEGVTTELKEKVRQGVQRMVYYLSQGPARTLQCERKKGQIGKGFDADIVIWNPFNVFKFDLVKTFQTSNLNSFSQKQNTLTYQEMNSLKESHIFQGKKFYGTVQMVIIRGHIAYEVLKQTKVDFENTQSIFHRVQGKDII